MYYPNGDVKEVEVLARSGHKFGAMGKVAQAVGVEGPNDASILGIMLQEVGKSKIYKAGKKLSNDKKSDENLDRFKRYRVSMFPTPLSAGYRVINLRSPDPYSALTSALAMCAVKSVEHVGPYIVEESDRDHAWTVRMAKNATRFGKDYGAATAPVNQRSGGKPKVIPTKQAVYQSVAEAFRLEKKAYPDRYTVKQDT